MSLMQIQFHAGQEIIQEQITRVLLERLIVNRPHPWGLLITFIELIKVILCSRHIIVFFFSFYCGFYCCNYWRGNWQVILSCCCRGMSMLVTYYMSVEWSVMYWKSYVWKSSVFSPLMFCRVRWFWVTAWWVVLRWWWVACWGWWLVVRCAAAVMICWG